MILNGCDKLPKAVSEPLVSYFENPSPTTVCLVVANTLAKSTRLYKSVAKLGPKTLVDCAPKKGREVPQQVVSMARAYGKTIDIMAAEELVSRVGENSRMLDNELKRLSAMLEGESISRSDIEAMVARTAEVKPWDLLNAVSARDMKRALELYQLQLPRNEVRLFSLLVTRLRELICAKALDARGEGRNLAQVLGLQGWQVRNHVGWARKYSMDELICALRAAVDVEAALKGSADSELALRLWIISLIERS